MDCEKFDSVMLDELYGELDELTSAAAKRHLSGCARCAAQYAGMKATRRVALLPLVDPPIDLEQRIFARVKEAQKVIPFRARAIKLVSLAGSWAMRPQTAMAAVFLLMIGSSVLFMRASSKRSMDESVRVSSGAGLPAQTIEDVPRDRMDFAAAASAHGTEPAKVAAAPTPALDPFAAADQAKNEQNDLASELRGTGGARGAGGAVSLESNAQPPAGTPMDTTALSPAMDQPMAQAEAKKTANQSDLDRGIGQYQNRNYDDAIKTLDGISGSPDAALWSARAVRDSKGCAAAVDRFDQLSARAFGTNAGYEATFDAAKCYEKLGKMDLARARYAKLLGVPTYAARAQNELDRLRPVAAKPAAPMRTPPNEKANSY
jgi:hypothetical protein